MYHLIYDSPTKKFIVIRDTDYICTNWAKTVTDLEFLLDGAAHWAKHDNIGKPIEDTLSNRQILLASADTFAEVTKDTYPELQI